ncbi:MAG: Acyl-CoA carboxylase component [Chlorobi bacterium]|nr:Acyl-CoA carboxylase component [Chlorobiota bacterium]
MKLLQMFAAIALLAIPASVASAGVYAPFPPATATAPAKPNPHNAELKALIDSGIRMLTAGEYVPFLKRFVDPAKAHEGKDVAEMAESFKEEKAAVLLNVLTEIRNKKPKYSRKGTRATYKLKENVKVHGEISFDLVDGLWYIVN